MSRFIGALRRFIADESSPTAVEYGVMVALMAAVVVVGIGALGVQTGILWNNLATTIVSAI
ncbi:MAG: Flp family type IVb pilin [Planctomycetes bacterium]|nr:Flp family type IVb pilin [Planctomycetota bacterium]